MAIQNDYLVRKKEKYQGLIKTPTFITDTSSNSAQYFVLSGIPDELTAGRNSIKITANLNTLRIGTEIAVEVLDQNDNPIYTEVNQYVDPTKRRIVTIYVYPETPAGLARITFLGVAKKYYTPNGQLFDIPTTWRDKYNVKWSRFIYIDPTKRNNTEIIFNKLPYIYVRETYKRSIITSFVPGNNISLSNIYSTVNYHNTTAPPLTLPDLDQPEPGGTITNLTDYPSSTTIDDSYGNYDPGTLVIYPDEDVSDEIKYDPPDGSTLIVPEYSEPTLPSSENLVYVDDDTRTYTNTFDNNYTDGGGDTYVQVTDSDGIYSPGGTALIQKLSPILTINDTNFFKFTKEMEGGFVGVPNPWSPKPTLDVGQTYKSTEDYAYYGVIKKVLSEKTVALENPYKRQILYDGVEYSLYYNKFENSSFYVSYSESPTFSQSEAYDSHAYIEMGNLKPITGDIYKIKVYLKSHSNPHDFNYIGEHILKSTNLFIDTGSIRTTDGIGIFNTSESLAFWTASSVNTAEPIALYTSSEKIINGLHLSGSENTIIGGWNNITTENYKLRFFKNVPYQISFDVVGQSRGTREAELELFISGSTVLGGGELFVGEIKVPVNSSRSYRQLTFPFKTNLLGNGKPIFRVKNGDWHLGNIKIQPMHHPGFAPEHTIFTMPVKSRWDGDILDFKFEFYNYAGEMCNKFMTYTNANFVHGPSQFIQGGDNLVTGSIFFGNVLYEGIEMAGLNSAYMRNIGYDGYNAAKDGSGGYGFMAWSGSIFPGGTDNYAGVGFELVGASGSLRFRTEPSLFEVIADSFYIGRDSLQYISGSDGNLEISSSDFHLKPDGTLIIGADATIFGSLAVNQLFLPATGPPYYTSLYSDGRAEFKSVEITGTLSTTVFEKESINAVGGQLIVANSTTIENGTADYKIYSGSLTDTIPVKNSDGFKRGEYLTAKSTSSTGFITEIMQINRNGVETTGSNVVGTVNDVGGGSLSWTNPSNLTLDDDNWAYVSGSYVGPYISDELQFTNFGFSIPSNAQILGVKVEVVYSASQYDDSPEFSAEEIKLLNTSNATEDKGSTTTVFDSTSEATQSWGGFADTWGGYITPSEVNSTDFGCNLIIGQKTLAAPTLFVDHLKMYISYETPNNSIEVTRNVDGLSTIPTMSESQVLVSLGKQDNGYIHLNAYPNTTDTPYMDIVERTGSGVNDIEIKVRLGDLSGLAGTGPVSSNPGYGLYSENVFLSGTITASAGRFGDDTEYMSFDGTNLVVETPNFSIDDTGQVIANNLYLSDTVSADALIFNVLLIDDATDWNTYCSESLLTDVYVIDLSGVNSAIDSSADGATFVRFNYAPSNAKIGWIKTAPEPQTNVQGGFVIFEGLANIKLATVIGQPWGVGGGINGNAIEVNKDFNEWHVSSWYNDGSRTVYEIKPGERVKLVKSLNDWKIQSSNKWQNINVLQTASFAGDNDTGIYNEGVNTLGFASNGSKVLTIDTTGIGLIDGSITNPSLHFENYDDYGFHYEDPGGLANDGIGVSMGGNFRQFLESDGDFHCNQLFSNNIGATSDIRLKENIVPLTDSLKKVLKLDGVNFNWKKGNTELNSGLIAQKVKDIIPEVVSKKYLALEKDEYYVIKYDQLIPYLIESIKELNDKIEKLENKK